MSLRELGSSRKLRVICSTDFVDMVDVVLDAFLLWSIHSLIGVVVLLRDDVSCGGGGPGATSVGGLTCDVACSCCLRASSSACCTVRFS